MPLRDFTRLQADPSYQAILVPGVIHVHRRQRPEPADGQQARAPSAELRDRSPALHRHHAAWYSRATEPALAAQLTSQRSSANRTSTRTIQIRPESLLSQAGVSEPHSMRCTHHPIPSCTTSRRCTRPIWQDSASLSTSRTWTRRPGWTRSTIANTTVCTEAWSTTPHWNP